MGKNLEKKFIVFRVILDQSKSQPGCTIKQKQQQLQKQTVQPTSTNISI